MVLAVRGRYHFFRVPRIGWYVHARQHAPMLATGHHDLFRARVNQNESNLFVRSLGRVFHGFVLRGAWPFRAMRLRARSCARNSSTSLQTILMSTENSRLISDLIWFSSRPWERRAKIREPTGLRPYMIPPARSRSTAPS